MNRRDFTLMIADQILFMAKTLDALEIAPQIDWTLRSVYDQYQMFKAGKSRCDGTIKRSKHQDGLAGDIFIIGKDKKGKLAILEPMNVSPVEWVKIRQHWINLGGEAMLPWDPCHFEVD